MAVSRDIFSHHDLGVEFHCQLMGRDHGCRSVPNNTQDSPAQQRIIQSKTSIALRLRNPGTILWGGGGEGEEGDTLGRQHWASLKKHI